MAFGPTYFQVDSCFRVSLVLLRGKYCILGSCREENGNIIYGWSNNGILGQPRSLKMMSPRTTLRHNSSASRWRTRWSGGCGVLSLRWRMALRLAENLAWHSYLEWLNDPTVWRLLLYSMVFL